MEDLSTHRENRRARLPGSNLVDTGGASSRRYEEGAYSGEALAIARGRLERMSGSVYVTSTYLIQVHKEDRCTRTLRRCAGDKGRRTPRAQSSKLNEVQRAPQHGPGMGLRIACAP